MDEYITSAGDTFDGIAYKKFENEMLASDIIALNPQYSNVITFGEGVTLILPKVVPAQPSNLLPPWKKEA